MRTKEHQDDPGEDDGSEKKNLRRRVWRGIKIGALSTFLGIGALTSFYAVPTESVGVVQRFGAYARTTEPGLRGKLPYGMERVKKVPVKLVQKEEFGFRTIKSGVRSEYLGSDNIDTVDHGVLANYVNEQIKLGYDMEGNSLEEKAKKILRNEYLMLTGDLNLADAEFIVQYKIKDPVAYLFNVQDQKKILRDMSAAAMREIVGDRSVDEAITIGRVEIQNAAQDRLQELLDNYESGVQIVQVKLQSVNPPENVRPAFNEVNEAKQNRETIINKAWAEYNQVIPKAEGDAQKQIELAGAYAVERVNNSRGDVQRFIQIQKEYEKAPDITRRRLYLETLGELLPKIKNKKIIEQKGVEGGLLLKLDLGGNSQ